ncbi:hypothetical protein [Klebsiella variicola]
MNAGCGGIDAYLGSFSLYQQRAAAAVRKTNYVQRRGLLL